MAEERKRRALKWRATIRRPTSHDGLWGWELEWMPEVSAEGEDPWCKKFPTMPGAPLPRGNASGHYAAMQAARAAKEWWIAQFAHEGMQLTSVVEV